MNERQRRISDALALKQPELSSLFQAAIAQLEQTPAQGDERLRVSQICHSMREVMNTAVRVWGRGSDIEIPISSKDQVQDLPDLLTRFPEMDLAGGGELVPVPRGAAEAFNELVKTAVQERRRSQSNVAGLLTDDDNRNAPAVRQWILTVKWFVKWAHIFNDPVELGELPTDAMMREKIEVFEELFYAFIARFFDLRHSLDDLLDEINSQEDD